MNCTKCGGAYVSVNGELVIFDKYVGRIRIANVSYHQCEKCKERLLPLETARKIDEKRQEVLQAYLKSQSISSFLSASETACFLDISRQALHKHKRIRKGLIYYTWFDYKVVYLHRSVELFKKKGDGRFDISGPTVIFDRRKSEWSSKLLIAPESNFTPKVEGGFGIFAIDPNSYVKEKFEAKVKVSTAWYGKGNIDNLDLQSEADEYDQGISSVDILGCFKSSLSGFNQIVRK